MSDPGLQHIKYLVAAIDDLIKAMNKHGVPSNAASSAFMCLVAARNDAGDYLSKRQSDED